MNAATRDEVQRVADSLRESVSKGGGRLYATEIRSDDRRRDNAAPAPRRRAHFPRRTGAVHVSLREFEDSAARALERKGLLLGEQPDDPPEAEFECELCADEGCVECVLYRCACDEIGGDSDCPACEGTLLVDHRNEWCGRCGLTGRCPDCDPDTYLDARRDR